MTEPPAGGTTVPAPAKVNLFLHVLGRRGDGYHLLDSLVAFADVADTVTVEAAEDLTLGIDGPFAAGVPTGDDNLVLRAAAALADATGVAAGARIRLTKRLPVAAGIGGGSADAAAALIALSRLWRVSPVPADLEALALGLGADVPACLVGRPAFVGGIGEDVAEAPPLPPCALILANPGVALPTPAVFKRREGPFSAPGRFDASPAGAADLARLLARRRNDLTAAAIALQPAIGTVLAALEALPGALLARMSGSGATCFALFATRDQAEAGADVLRQAQPAWWLEAAELLH
ncbi:MAG: 4-(cytidine 5'-diphospho)-2-C-methyl-D-erythritol kinase [Rhodospirillales bacterium]